MACQVKIGCSRFWVKFGIRGADKRRRSICPKVPGSGIKPERFTTAPPAPWCIGVSSVETKAHAISPRMVISATHTPNGVQTPSTRTAAHNASTAAMREVGTVNNPRRVYSPMLADTSYRRKTLRHNRFDSDPT